MEQAGRGLPVPESNDGKRGENKGWENRPLNWEGWGCDGGELQEHVSWGKVGGLGILLLAVDVYIHSIPTIETMMKMHNERDGWILDCFFIILPLKGSFW